MALSKEAALQNDIEEVNAINGNTNSYVKKVPDKPLHSEIPTGKWKCKSCELFHTGRQVCKYAKNTCSTCKKVCQSVTRANQHILDIETDQVEINHIYFCNDKPLYLDVLVNDYLISCQLDSGAAVSVLSFETYQSYLKSVKLLPSTMIRRSYSGDKIKPVGQMLVNIITCYAKTSILKL